jgi:hypothetical protein
MIMHHRDPGLADHRHHHHHHHHPHRSSELIGSAAIAFSAFEAEGSDPLGSPVHRRSCPNDIR